ncbi:lysophospholipid acyltransferase 5-like [Haliotis rufescens]|uniref:lysophospholipid acyltransferase 5-like n=1 Tax=Haliotis rufescens TaxID=6454 RepID=UPI00201F6599|nr:lysophospholipid acyltransferase 5-like [Haliotis rufescens]
MVVAAVVSFIATWIGASDNAIRLLLSLFAGYPLAFLYRHWIILQPAPVKHIFFTVCGLVLCYFNFGDAVSHSLVNILVDYVILCLIPGTALSVALAFVFNTFYLMAGYYKVETDDYQIMWTMPHCVLTLRLTSVIFDVYDGHRKQRKAELTPDQSQTALEKTPSLLEMFGHCYYFGGFLIGPQFSMRRYLNFIDGAFQKTKEEPPDSVYPGVQRLLLGLVYIVIFQTGNLLVPDDYLLSLDFENVNFLARCAYVLIWGKLVIMKYVGSWLLAEGSIIISGLSYNGKDENGKAQWDGCTNVNLTKLESAVTFHQMIQSFNINTNMWMSKYIFKRLRFLGNKFVSQGVTLLYLAVWHGLHTGYYMCFMLEFFMTNTQNQLGSLVDASPQLKSLVQQPSIKIVLWGVSKIITTFSLSYALVGFGLLTVPKWTKVYASIYYIGHVVFLGWPVVYILLKKFVLPRKRAVNGIQNTHMSEEKKDT